MQRFAIIAAAALAAGSLGYVGCDRDETATNTTSETAGDKVDRAMDRAGDATGKAVDKTVEAGRDVADKTAEVGRDVGDKASEVGRDLSAKASRAGDDLAESASNTIRNADKGTAAAPDAEGIRDILASATEAALTRNGLDDLTERLVDADRNRIGEGIGADFADHAALVDQFRADWKAKYGKDFDIKEESALPEAMFSVKQGEIGQAAAGAEVDVDRKADGSATVDVDRKSGVDSPDSAAADANRNDPGRNIATVSVKASHGMPALTVPLIHEGPDNWRIDAPDSLDADKLKQNVVEHLRAAHAMKDQWPADVNEAYASVAHHVLMAILDQPVQQK